MFCPSLSVLYVKTAERFQDAHLAASLGSVYPHKENVVPYSSDKSVATCGIVYEIFHAYPALSRGPF